MLLRPEKHDFRALRRGKKQTNFINIRIKRWLSAIYKTEKYARISEQMAAR